MAETPQTPKDDDTVEASAEDITEDAGIVEATAEEIEIVDPADIRNRRNRLRAAWIAGGVVVLVAGAVALVMLRPDLFQRPASGADPVVVERIDALSQEVAGIKKDLTAVMTSVRALAQTGTDGAAAALATRLDAIEKRLAKAQAASGGGVSDDMVASLTARIAALEARPAAGSETGSEAAQAAAKAAASAADERIAALTAAAETREKNVATLTADNERLMSAVSALAAKVADLQKSASAGNKISGRVAALVLAAGQLREALSGTAPFAAELNALKALADGDDAVGQAVAALAPHAAKGIATRSLLLTQFDPMAREVVRVAIAPGDGGWWDRAMSRLAGLVTVRPTGADVAGDSPSAALARSEARLAAGDLDGAVKALAALDGAPQKAAAAWLSNARARLAADQAAAALSRDVIGRIAQGPTSPSDPSGPTSAPASAPPEPTAAPAEKK